MNLVEKHIRKTEGLLRAIDKTKIADWLLNEGYFPEQYVLPPTFKVQGFALAENPKNADIKDLARREIVSISYPKTLLTSREFGIQHPNNYHDIVFYLMQDWDAILDIIFHKDLKIFSYSFPIPVNARDEGNLSPLRSGRMIYEWIAMAEKDLVAEAHQFNYIVRSDITNFYNSVYTHSIAWALHGQEDAFNDMRESTLTGNKIDRLVQYANKGRTNGLPVGSALSDLIAETILAAIDLNVSKKAQLQGIEFLATRFKDDYRILCNKKEDGETILKILADELRQFNLSVNETKTIILDLPTGLYRHHDRAYHPHSLRTSKEVDFKTFELTLLRAMDIHREYPGTSILEKFFSELFDDESVLKIKFSNEINSRKKQILKTFSLLMLLKRESEKVLCHVLAIIEAIYLKYRKDFDLKTQLQTIIKSEIKKASDKKSIFELVWLVFYARYLSLGITNLTELISSDNLENDFLKSMTTSQQKIFNDSGITLFRKPSECKDLSLAKRLAIFDRTKEE
jgi:retron-type reverse transcriptase